MTDDSSALDTEIADWKNFSEILRENDRVLFTQMLEECREYKDAINSKGELFTVESLLMSLILNQQKLIKELIKNIQGNSLSSDKPNHSQTI